MEIVSLVATVILDGPLDLGLLQRKIEGSELTKANGGWLKYRLKPEMRYIAFYRNGKFLITGKDLQDNISGVSERVLKLIIKAGFNRKIKKIEINNIVGKARIEGNPTLESFIVNNPDKSEYEPEQFPALIYRDWNLTFLLFSTGSTIITGAKTLEQLESGFKKFKKLVQIS